MLPIQCCCPLTDASWQLAVLRVVRWAAGQWQLVTTFRDMQLQLWQVGQHAASLELVALLQGATNILAAQP
jgi:hypothetical protein